MKQTLYTKSFKILSKVLGALALFDSTKMQWNAVSFLLETEDSGDAHLLIDSI